MARAEVTTIGKYQVLERISTGDVAEIFKARLEGIAGFRRTFAIKRIRPHLAKDESYTQMIEEEARVAGLLSHGNIVQLLDLGRDAGALYLVMEHVDGWDLGAVLAAAEIREAPIPVEHVITIGTSILKALEYAHQREVLRDGETVPLRLIHRDVSPSNILLSRAGDVKLTDFGIARASLKLMQTRPELLARTFDYMSPEAARGRDLTQAADLFSLAVVLYECLTLQHPFRKEGEMATLEAIQSGAFTPLDTLRPELPADLVTLLHGALAVDPAERPASATAFKDGLIGVELGLGEGTARMGLAPYLRELFPDPVEDVAPRSRPLDVAQLPGPELEELPADAEHTVPARYADFGDEDAQTVVVGLDGAQGGEDVLVDEDGATVVNPDLVKQLERLRGVADKPAPEPSSDATRVRRGGAEGSGNESAALLSGLVSGGLALVIGVLLGAVLTVAYVRAGGMLVNPPQLDIRSDPGVRMEVSVDGQVAAAGPQQLAPGVHPIKVAVDGATPWEFDLELQEGEFRVMVITSHQASPPPPAPPR